MRKFYSLCLSLILLLLGFSSVQADEVLKVGVALPLTGPLSKTASDMQNGIILAADEWNAKGGVLGKRIELIVEDDHGDPLVAERVAEDLSNLGVVGVIGHMNSGCSLAGLVYYNRAGIPMITPGSTNPSLTAKGYGGVFRVCGKDDNQAAVAADFIAKFKLRKIAFVHDQSIYGQWLINEFMKDIRKRSVVRTVYYASFNDKSRDFQPILKSVVRKKPDLIYFGASYTDAADFLKQARELGVNSLFMSGDSAANQEFVTIAGVNNTRNVYFTSNPDIKKMPSAADFVTNYEKRFGAIGTYSVYGYDAANVLLSAITEAKSINGLDIIKALHDEKFHGALGTIKFNEQGDIEDSNNYVVWTIKEGKIVEY